MPRTIPRCVPGTWSLSRTTASSAPCGSKHSASQMASKRQLDIGSNEGREQQREKRMRRPPSFSTVIREAMTANKLRSFFLTLEPMFRKVIQEEIESILNPNAQLLKRNHQPQNCESQEPPLSLRLVFKNSPSTPVFTGSRVECMGNTGLQIVIANVDDLPPSCSLHSPIKLQLVAVEGDFASGGDQEDWTSEEFQRSIVKERDGKRPLLVGDVNPFLMDGVAHVSDLSFTDNSSWTKSGRFRIGARVAPGSGYCGPRIREAITQAFKVKEHRGESYKKHYPPALSDKVWRVVNIGKGGVFHDKLASNNINTVQDLLKMMHVDTDGLRGILGAGMSDRTWEATASHAKTCVVGDKLFWCRGLKCDLLLNQACEVVRVVAGSNMYTLEQLNRNDRDYVRQLTQEAFKNWDSLEEFKGTLDVNPSQNW